MDIEYRDTKDIDAGRLQALFASVGWRSAQYPTRLRQAMAGSSAVYTAWCGGRLAGLVNALDDGALTAYVHYLLVDPHYQGHGIGRRLLEMVKQRYAGYLSIVLVSETAGTVPFYQSLGFAPGAGSTPMYLRNTALEPL